MYSYLVVSLLLFVVVFSMTQPAALHVYDCSENWLC